MAQMKYHFKSTQRNASIISIACLLFFVVYSLYFFIGYQSDLVALSRFLESSEPSTPESLLSHAWWGGLISAILCLVPAILLLRCLHFPLRFKALALLPSFVVLGLITGMSPSTVNASEISIPLVSTIALTIVSLIAIFLSQLFHEDKGEHGPLTNYLSPNIFILCIGAFFSISITNTDRELHLQLEAARQAFKGNYEAIGEIFVGETTTNTNITALQILALSKRGEMPKRLFEIDHLAGSFSLMPDSTPSSLLYQSPHVLYSHLRAVPIGFKGDVTTFLEKALERKKSVMRIESGVYRYCRHQKPLVDYYLCALLLDRNLTRFVAELPQYYNLSLSLPRPYAEAIAIYRTSLPSEAQGLYTDELTESLFNQYQTLRSSYPDNAMIQRKEALRAYKGSYWNYYFFR